MKTDDHPLTQRYGAPQVSARRVGIGALVAIGVVAAVWLAWVTLAYSAPDVRSQLTGWEVVDDNTTTATVTIDIEAGVSATCRVRAVSEDHSVVGELGFRVDGDDFGPDGGLGRVTHTLRTERVATAVESLGCTAPGQSRAR